MDPATLGFIFSAASSVFSIVKGISDSNTEKQNALNQKADAASALQIGQANAERQRGIVRAQQAKLVAETGASGTTFTGSPMEVFLENAKQGELTAQDELFQGQIRARGLKIQASQSKKAASSALVGGIASGVGSLGSTLLSRKT